MSTGMGAANPKFSKSGRKPKKTKHCTIPKIFDKYKEKQKGLPSKGIDLIKMTVKSKIIKMRVCNMIHQDQVWGKNFFSDINRKEKDEGRDKDAKSEDWNLGNF